MKIMVRMESIDDDIIFEISRRLEQDISRLDEINIIDLFEIENGVLIILRVYPEADYIYPAYSKPVRNFRKKDKLVLVSSNIYLETLKGLNHAGIYNLFLDNVINSLFILEDKKINGADIKYLSTILKGLYQ
jgi:hypothetical protein